jgi:LmbE family N-acetylglucosaminyl deacetylase
MLSFRKVARGLYLAALRFAITRASIVPVAASIVVFAPHPDDETLGCGGIIARAVQRSSDVQIVFMTSGDAGTGDGFDAAEAARMRCAEARSAAAVLGVDADRLTFFGFPDGALATYRAQAISRVAVLLARERPGQVFIPYRKDVHEDHVATAEIVIAALTIAKQNAEIYEYPIWFFYFWPLVALHVGMDPSGTRRLPIAHAIRRTMVSTMRLYLHFRRAVALEPATAERKRQALLRYVSQTSPLGAVGTTVNLADISGGDFLGLFADVELFGRVRARTQAD